MAIKFNPERLLTIRAMLVDGTFDQLRLYALLLSNGMEKEFEHASAKSQLRFSQILTAEEQQLCEDYYDAIGDGREVFPQLLWNNSFASFYFYFEHTFVTFCKDVQKLKKSNVGVSDMNGHGIVQCRKYLHKVHAFDFGKVNQEWTMLVLYNQIRNLIVHNGGFCDPDKHKDLSEQLQKLDGITLKHNYVVASKVLCLTALDNMKSFIKTLFLYCEGDKGEIVLR